MITKECYTLNNGVLIPKIGLGTWFIKDEEVADVVEAAINLGYTHVDTAQAYGNERGVGDGINRFGKDREKLFVTSKVAAEYKTYAEAAKSIDDTLKRMNLDYLDLMLIHSPEPWDTFHEGDFDEGNREAWRALEDAYKAGKLRAIGVSNFRQKDIDNILSHCRIKPMVNQLLVHISNTPTALINYSKQHGMLVEAYSPIGHGVILDHPELQEMALKYGATVSQLCIRYTLQLGTLPLPKTRNISHLKDNLQVDFEICDEDMQILKKIEKIKDYGKHTKFPVFSGK